MNIEDYKIAYENVMTANKMLEKELDKFRPFTSAYEMKQEIERLKQQIDDIKSFCKSFDLNKISDKEKVMLDSIMLIANGTIKVVREDDTNGKD